jgi:hypothetical protein
MLKKDAGPFYFGTVCDVCYLAIMLGLGNNWGFWSGNKALLNAKCLEYTAEKKACQYINIIFRSFSDVISDLSVAKSGFL